MSDIGQRLTADAYENPEIVAGYIKEHSISPKISQVQRAEFAASLPGKRLLDLGCGPGHDSYAFAEMGLEVTGVDLSVAMINAAKSLRSDVKNKPTFVVGDLLNLDAFDNASFDGVWACASLVHVPTQDLPQALSEMRRLLVPGGQALIAVKGGAQHEVIVEENKYGPAMKRQFTFWDADYFSEQLRAANFAIIELDKQTKQNRQGTGETVWLNYSVEAI